MLSFVGQEVHKCFRNASKNKQHAKQLAE